MKVAKVILPVAIERRFDYLIPDELELTKGNIVEVNFRGKMIYGIVDVVADSSEIEKLKYVERKIFEIPVPEKILNFIEWISEYYFTSKGLILKNFLPDKTKIPAKYVCVSRKREFTELYYETQKRALSKSEIEKLIKIDVDKMIEGNILKEDIFPYRKPSYVEKRLTGEQENAYLKLKESVDENQFKTFLLYGQPATGKTEVYIKLIRYVIENTQKNILLLLPEIGLVEQSYSILSELFGSTIIAKVHSELSKGEFNFIFKEILSNNRRIVIGTRSSIFLPFLDPGLIIVDEEQDLSFKQYDMAPFYNARDSAIYLGKLFNSTVLLVSATPSLETYNNVLKGKYQPLTLNQKYYNAEKPEVQIIYSETGYKNISKNSIDLILNSLEENEQVIVFLNRRGYLNLYRCSVCGEFFKCDNCAVSYSYHKSFNSFICHYCGDRKPVDSKCPLCGGKIVPAGIWGTEMVESIFKKIFKNKVIERFDIDITTKKGARKKIIEDFIQHKIDILIGTQMVSKGYDVPNVSTVLILNFDSSINLPEIRSVERFMQLLVQTSGRAGRRDKQGKIIIESSITNEKFLKMIKNLDYTMFLEDELKRRRERDFPPFKRMLKISHRNKDRDECWNNIKKIHGILIEKNIYSDIKIFPPGFYYIERINRYYRTEIFIFYENFNHIKKLLDNLKNLKFEYYIDNDAL